MLLARAERVCCAHGSWNSQFGIVEKLGIVERDELFAAVRKSTMPWSGSSKSQYVKVSTALFEHVTSTARRLPPHGAGPKVASFESRVHAGLPTHAAATAADTSLVQAPRLSELQKPVGCP